MRVPVYWNTGTRFVYLYTGLQGYRDTVLESACIQVYRNTGSRVPVVSTGIQEYRHTGRRYSLENTRLAALPDGFLVPVYRHTGTRMGALRMGEEQGALRSEESLLRCKRTTGIQGHGGSF